MMNTYVEPQQKGYIPINLLSSEQLKRVLPFNTWRLNNEICEKRKYTPFTLCNWTKFFLLNLTPQEQVTALAKIIDVRTDPYGPPIIPWLEYQKTKFHQPPVSTDLKQTNHLLPPGGSMVTT